MYSGDIDLADYSFAATNTIDSIAMTDASAKFGATNVIAKAALDGTATHANIVATGTLTLGGTEAIGAASLEAKNLTIESDGEYTLQDAVTLKAMGDSKDAEGNPIKVAQDGKIVGKAINVKEGKSLTVAAGNYTFGEDVTLTKGKLEVNSAEKVKTTGNDTVASSLKLAKANVTLKAHKTDGSGSIVVSGKNATLDLSEANSVTLEAATSTDAPDANILSANVSEATVVLKDTEQVDGLVKTIASTKYSSINLAKGGTLKIVDDLTIDGAKLKGADASTAAPQQQLISIARQMSQVVP